MATTPEATDSAPLYQVKNWDAHFEGAKSKTYNNKTACTMPTKHGLGYKRLVKRKDGAALFGAWCALVQILSRHPKTREGYCTDTGRIDGRPYDPSDLECLSDIPAKHFKSMYEICASQVVDWLELIAGGIQQGYNKDSKYPLNLDLDSNLDSDSDSNLKARGRANSVECFEQCWKLYPNKDGKAAARKAYLKYKPDVEAVKAGIQRYIDHVLHQRASGFNDLKYANGSTWFNQQRWESEYEVAPSHTTPTANRQKKADVEFQALKEALMAVNHDNAKMYDIICNASHEHIHDLEQWAMSNLDFVIP